MLNRYKANESSSTTNTELYSEYSQPSQLQKIAQEKEMRAMQAAELKERTLANKHIKLLQMRKNHPGTFAPITTLLIDWDKTLCHNNTQIDMRACELLTIAKQLGMLIRIFTARNEDIETEASYFQLQISPLGKKQFVVKSMRDENKVNTVLRNHGLDRLITPEMIHYCNLNPVDGYHQGKPVYNFQAYAHQTKREGYQNLKKKHSLLPFEIAVFDDMPDIIHNLEDLPDAGLVKLIVGKNGTHTPLYTHLERVLPDVVLYNDHFPACDRIVAVQRLLSYFEKYAAALFNSETILTSLNTLHQTLSNPILQGENMFDRSHSTRSTQDHDTYPVVDKISSSIAAISATAPKAELHIDIHIKEKHIHYHASDEIKTEKTPRKTRDPFPFIQYFEPESKAPTVRLFGPNRVPFEPKTTKDDKKSGIQHNQHRDKSPRRQ